MPVSCCLQNFAGQAQIFFPKGNKQNPILKKNRLQMLKKNQALEIRLSLTTLLVFEY